MPLTNNKHNTKVLRTAKSKEIVKNTSAEKVNKKHSIFHGVHIFFLYI